MHDRPPSAAASAPPSASVASPRPQQYRRRCDDGRFKVWVEIGADEIELLVGSHWLPEGESHDRKKIAQAIAALLADAAKR